MTTSGVTAWSLTALEIITEALSENGILPIGEVPEAAEAEKCLIRLNGLLKSWCIGLHLETTGTVTIAAGEASGTLNAAIKEVRSGRVVESATYERQIIRWERDEYFSIPNKLTTGRPVAFYPDSQREAVVLYVWPVPATETELKIEYQRFPDTVTELTETVDIPQNHLETLYACLAVRCAGLFGVQPTQELYERAKMLERMMMDEERPASYFMEAF